jgi:NTE family protein
MPGLDLHAGMWLALQEAGIVATDCAGTSAGAIVGAMDAAGLSPERAIGILVALSDSDMRAPLPFWKLRIPWLDYWLRLDPIRAVLESTLPASWDQMVKRLSVWSTRLGDYQAVNVARPELAATPTDAVLSSMAISGIFPSVGLLDGNAYCDGGPRRNLPLPANWRDYDEVWLLIGSTRPKEYKRTGGILTHLIRNVEIAFLDQVLDVLDQVKHAPNVHVLWPAIPVRNGLLHFDHDLIGQAFDYAQRTIAGIRTGTPQPAEAP